MNLFRAVKSLSLINEIKLHSFLTQAMASWITRNPARNYSTVQANWAFRQENPGDIAFQIVSCSSTAFPSSEKDAAMANKA